MRGSVPSMRYSSYGESRSSLLIESTDSMIINLLNEIFMLYLVYLVNIGVCNTFIP